MSRLIAPGSQISSMRFNSQATGTRTITPTDDFKLMGDPISRTPMEDAHTGDPKFVLKHRFKRFEMSGVTDQDLSWLPNFENGTVTISFLNGRIISFRGATHTTEDGVTETVTTGKTDALNFTYREADDRG